MVFWRTINLKLGIQLDFYLFLESERIYESTDLIVDIWISSLPLTSRIQFVIQEQTTNYIRSSLTWSHATRFMWVAHNIMFVGFWIRNLLRQPNLVSRKNKSFESLVCHRLPQRSNLQLFMRLPVGLLSVCRRFCEIYK